MTGTLWLHEIVDFHGPLRRPPPKRAIAALLAFGIFVIWPTVDAWRLRHAVTVALRTAASIRLEEFAFHRTLASVELPRSEWPQFVGALPVVPDVGMPGLVKLCFIPHHRIVVTDSRGGRFEFTVCFQCDQLKVGQTGIVATPYLWQGSLRRLFGSHRVLIRSDREYNRLLDEELFRRPGSGPEARILGTGAPSLPTSSVTFFLPR